MGTKAIYTNEPPVLSVEPGHCTGGKLHYTVCCNQVEIPEKGWEVDKNDFWEHPGVVDEEAVRRNPDKWLSYVPQDELRKLRTEYTERVQEWMDGEAGTHGYDNIQSACTYENSSVPSFKAEGQACRQWRDDVWSACYAYLDAVLTGEEPLVPVDELIARLPQMRWPN